MTRLALIAMVGLSFTGAAGAETATKKWTVSPGQSIQDAVDKAEPGDTVQVLPGEYVQSVEIKKDGIVLAGMEYEGERTTLKAKDAEENEALKQAITVTGNNVTVQGFVISGHSVAGVDVHKCKGAILRDLLILDTGLLGLSLDGVVGGTIDRAVAGGARIGGISITRSSEITITNSEAFRSGIGLGMEGTQQVTVDNCSFHGNAVGVVLMSTSLDEGKATSYTKILRSRIMGNTPASAALDKAITYRFPAGIGALIWGADHTEVAHCVVADNATMGIATLGFDKDGARHLEKDAKRSGPPAEFMYAHHNIYATNGTAPAAEFGAQFAKIPAGDLYWDGTGEKNQWQENVELKTYPEKLVVKQGGVHTKVIHFQ